MPLLMAFCAGSSPRMRGAPDKVVECIAGVGIIPADAGSTQGLPTELS